MQLVLIHFKIYPGDKAVKQIFLQQNRQFLLEMGAKSGSKSE